MSVNDAQCYHTNQVHYVWASVAYTDSSAVSLGWIPKNATVTDAYMIVTTAFNAATTNTMDIGFRNAGDGTADDTDEFATAIAAGTAGKISEDAMATAGDLYFPEGAEMVATYAQSGTAATAGAARVVVEYVVDNSQ